MKERPTVFRAPMVRTILAGQKTQMRMAMKPQPTLDDRGLLWWEWSRGTGSASIDPVGMPSTEWLKHCPYGQPGDLLWVREAWAAPHACDHLVPSRIPCDARIHYAATEARGGLMWRSPIFMPRKYSRITLEIVSVRVERLQDISHADAMSEGMALDDAIYDYSRLWESLYGAGSWAKNPRVWVVEFKHVEGGAA